VHFEAVVVALVKEEEQLMQPAKYGIIMPGVTLAGGAALHASWERDLTPGDLARIAETADRLGYHHITCSEHVGIPPEIESIRGGRYYDPLATFGFLAAGTRRIRFATHVLVLGYSHPLEIAKRYGTLDRLSGGRLVLGVGVGSLKPEFDLLGLGGVEFDRRGARGDDAIKALRASFGKSLPEYHGPFYRFSGFIIDPCGLQDNVPIWIGGRSTRSLRRAVVLGDGWMPFGLSVAQMGEMIAAAKNNDAWHERERPLECVLAHEGQIDPAGHPAEASEKIASVFAAGGTIASITCQSCSLEHYIEQLDALAALMI
jgi:probable F420-dependent oxidoreductase